MSRVVIVLALIGVVACADPVPGIHAVAPCTGHVALKVGTGTTPTITWQPACAVALLSVTAAADSLGEAFLWFAGSATFGATIAPPVVYGRTPPGAGPDPFPADSLVVGRQYIVRLNTSMFLRAPALDSLVFTVQPPAP